MRKLLNNNKGFQISEVPALGVALLTIAIILAVGVTILVQVLETQHCPSGYYWEDSDSMCYTNSTKEIQYRTIGFNATYEGTEGIEDLSDWQTTWAVIIAAAVVIGIITTYMFVRARGG